LKGKIQFAISVVAILTLVMIALNSPSVSAYSGYGVSGPDFNTTYYQLGSSGSFTVWVEFDGGAADIALLGVHLYFVKVDGTLYQSQFFGANYGNNPLLIPADTRVALTYNFQIPNEQSLISGRFYYVLYMTHREHGTVTYTTDTFGPYEALSEGYYCYLYNPLHPDYGALQAQVTSLQSQVNELQSQVDELQDDKKSLQSQVNNLQSQLSSLQVNNTNLQTQINNLNSQIDNLQSRLNDVNARNATLTNLLLFVTVIASVFIVTTVYLILRKTRAKVS
jgi:FtsZ-binding cell division protein ZapB